MTQIPVPLVGQTPSALGSRAIDADVAAVVATTLKALAEPLRLRMLSLLATAPGYQACVCDLMVLTDLSQPTVSHHLKVLRDVGVLVSERRGTWVWYSVAPAYRDLVTTLLGSFVPTVLDAQPATEPTSPTA